MKKLDANSLADLVRMADTLGLPYLRMDEEVSLSPDHIRVHEADAATGHTLKDTPATCDTLPTPAVSPTQSQDSPAGDEPFKSLER
jgi:hypothetical protein